MIISASKNTAKKFNLSEKEKHVLEDTRSEKENDKAKWTLLHIQRINYHHYEPLQQTWLRVTKKHISLVVETFEAQDCPVNEKSEITGLDAMKRVVINKNLSRKAKVQVLKAMQESSAFGIKVKSRPSCETELLAQGRLEDVANQLIIALSENTLEQSSLKTYVPNILNSTQQDTQRLQALIQVNQEMTALLNAVNRVVNPTEEDDED
jgi:ribosomal protein L14E/L6E/L27E